MVPYMVPYRYEMVRKSKLFNKAKNSPDNFKFKELCTLAENVGFIFRNQTGSHKIYKHKLFNKIMNFQPDKHDKSKAKKYQTNQLINFIEEFNFMED